MWTSGRTRYRSHLKNHAKKNAPYKPYSIFWKKWPGIDLYLKCGFDESREGRSEGTKRLMLSTEVPRAQCRIRLSIVRMVDR